MLLYFEPAVDKLVGFVLVLRLEGFYHVVMVC
jgi:hypothetical protein